MLRRIVSLVAALIFGMFSLNTFAADIKLNGFASAYARASLTEDPHSLWTDGKGVNYSNDTKIGLNLRSDYEENWSANAQLVAAQKSILATNSSPTWAPGFDWFFVTYDDPATDLSINVGRQLFPGTLTAEYVDVGLTYPWRRLPEQFASIQPFKAFEGVSVQRQMNLFGQALSIRVFGGGGRPNGFDTVPPTTAEIDDLIGTRLNLEGDGWKLHSTYSQFHVVQLIPSYTATPTPPSNSTLNIIRIAIPGTIRVFTLGAHYEKESLMIYSEYSQSHLSETDAIFTSRELAKGYYSTLGYHFGKFLPHYTYSYAKFDAGHLIAGHEKSHALGLNYQMNPSTVVKGEYLIQEDTHGALVLSSEGTARSVALGINLVF